MRQGIARILRRLSTLAIDEISLSSAVLFSDDEAHIKAETERLMGEVKEIKAALREQDGLVLCVCSPLFDRVQN